MTAVARLTVVVCPDSFKGSLPAHEAAAAVASGLRDAAATAGVDLEVRLRPVADGGEGSVDVVRGRLDPLRANRHRPHR